MATKREKKSDTPQVPSKPRAPRARKPPASKPLAVPRPARRPAAPKKSAAAPRAKAPARRAAPKAVKPVTVLAGPALTDEERIEDAKYQPRTAPKRLFEEERFVFPESYGVTRIRLLVKDPEWIFVHWDVDSKTLAALRGELGERTMALTRLTLRIVDAEHGGGQTILLPPGARSWYVRADATGPRAYRAELGVTLPSGGFRALAESNAVVPPRVGPSPDVARLKRRFGRPPAGKALAPSRETVAAAPIASAEAASSPWQPSPERTDGGADPQPLVAGVQPKGRKRGGASELSGRPDRGGASDVHRR
jgi:hypothetical protein